jgi:transcriptional regulator with XRE-family HTH domain
VAGLRGDAERKRLRQLLREARIAAGLRQADVAARLGEPQSYVSKYESGERRLDIVELWAILDALGVSLAEFARRLEQGS